MVKLHGLQLVSGPNVEENFLQVEKLMSQVSLDADDHLFVLPECFASFGAGDKHNLAISELKGDGPIQNRLSKLASDYGVWVVAGTIPLKCTDENKFTASSLLFSATGDVICEYQKIHLFDVNITDGTRNYSESKYTFSGNEVVTANTPFGRLGLSVCYDLRFAGLYQAMDEVDVIVAPSAFTQLTGEAHWQTLIQARAVEKQCYVVAANQGGLHQNGRETYGHTQIISPWGESLCCHKKGEGLVSVEMDFARIAEIKRSIPVGTHNKFRSTLIENS